MRPSMSLALPHAVTQAVAFLETTYRQTDSLQTDCQDFHVQTIGLAFPFIPSDTMMALQRGPWNLHLTDEETRLRLSGLSKGEKSS